MTTLAANTPRDYEVGERNDIPVIASDIIYVRSGTGELSHGETVHGPRAWRKRILCTSGCSQRNRSGGTLPGG